MTDLHLSKLIMMVLLTFRNVPKISSVNTASKVVNLFAILTRETYPQTFSPELLFIGEYNSRRNWHVIDLLKMDNL